MSWTRKNCSAQKTMENGNKFCYCKEENGLKGPEWRETLAESFRII